MRAKATEGMDLEAREARNQRDVSLLTAFLQLEGVCVFAETEQR